MIKRRGFLRILASTPIAAAAAAGHNAVPTPLLSPPAAPEPYDRTYAVSYVQRVAVRAKARGFYGNQRRYVGDKFVMEIPRTAAGALQVPSWVEVLQ